MSDEADQQATDAPTRAGPSITRKEARIRVPGLILGSLDGVEAAIVSFAVRRRLRLRKLKHRTGR